MRLDRRFDVKWHVQELCFDRYGTFHWYCLAGAYHIEFLSNPFAIEREPFPRIADEKCDGLAMVDKRYQVIVKAGGARSIVTVSKVKLHKVLNLA
jgi:hypothetical protein